MTYANGALDPSDARAYNDGELVGYARVDVGRQHQQFKLQRELHGAQGQHQQRPVYTSRPTPVVQLGRGPVFWNAAPAGASLASIAAAAASSGPSIAGRAPVPPIAKRQEEEAQERQQQQRYRLAAASVGHVAPSIHTILEIARSSSGTHGRPPSTTTSLTDMPLTTSRYHSKSPDQRTSPSRARGGGSSATGVITGPPHRPVAQVQKQEHVSRQKARSIPSAVVPSPNTCSTVGSAFGGSGTPLRRGKWTKAEEEFTAATIRYFCGGLLNLQFGTLLRGFLAQQLHCHPMRISKKLLPGTTFCGVEISRKLGRRAYSPRWCDSPLATQQKLDAEDHLAQLRTKFIASIEEEAADDDIGEESRELCRAAERLSETSESRASTETASVAESPPSVVKSETTRAGSPAVLQQQQRYQQQIQIQQQPQQMYQYQQQQQVVGQKRSRGENDWATVEQRPHLRTQQHHQPHQQNQHSHQQHQQQQHPYYSQSHATSQRWDASPPIRSSPPQLWHSSSQSPLPPPIVTGSHGSSQPALYYESVHRVAKLPRLHQQQQQHQVHVHQPMRPSVPSPPSTMPMLPSLRASLERASTYHDL